MRDLVAERAKVVISDPKAIPEAKHDLADIIDKVEFAADPYEAAKGAHAIAVVTEWDSFKSLDYKKIFDSMSKPAFVFDGRNILDHKALYEIGFSVFPIGKPEFSHLEV